MLTGFDGSPNSAVALRRAATEARERHARLDVVRVVPRGGLARVPAAWLRLRGEVARVVPRAQHVSTRLRVVRGDAAEQPTRLAAHADGVGARTNSRHGAPLGGETVPAILSAVRRPVQGDRLRRRHGLSSDPPGVGCTPGGGLTAGR